MNKMKMSTLSSSRLHLLKCTTTNLANSTSSSSNLSFLNPISSLPQPKHPVSLSSALPTPTGKGKSTFIRQEPKCLEISSTCGDRNGNVKFLIMGAVSVGVVMLLMDQQKAMALGPEGPLMEEFWDNVRRYALYALTVSTGALYTVFQPIYELLKNPISAILVLVILGEVSSLFPKLFQP